MKEQKTIKTDYLVGETVVLYKKPTKETDTIINCLVKDTVREVRQLSESSYYRQEAQPVVMYKLYNNNYSPKLYKGNELAADIEQGLNKFYAVFEKDLANLKQTIANKAAKQKSGDVIEIWQKMKDNPEVYREVYALFEAEHKASKKKGKKTK